MSVTTPPEVGQRYWLNKLKVEWEVVTITEDGTQVLLEQKTGAILGGIRGNSPMRYGANSVPRVRRWVAVSELLLIKDKK